MGRMPSYGNPAKDYAERTLSPEVLCGVTANTRIIETDSGYAVINKEHAAAVLKGGHRKAKRQSSKVHLDTPGNPYVAAEGVVELDSRDARESEH